MAKPDPNEESGKPAKKGLFGLGGFGKNKGSGSEDAGKKDNDTESPEPKETEPDTSGNSVVGFEGRSHGRAWFRQRGF